MSSRAAQILSEPVSEKSSLRTSALRVLLVAAVAIAAFMGSAQVAASGDQDANPGDIDLGDIGNLGGPDGFGDLVGPGGPGIGLPGMDGPGGEPGIGPDLPGIPKGDGIKDGQDDKPREPDGVKL